MLAKRLGRWLAFLGALLTLTRTLTLEPWQTEELITTYIYDGANRLIETIDPAGERTRTVYNDVGKPTSTFDKLDRETRYIYDTHGNLVQTIYPADTSDVGVAERTVYDAQNRPFIKQERALISWDDPYGTTAGNGTRTVYDALGRVIRTERLSNLQVSVTKDELTDEITAQVMGQPTIVSSTSTIYDPAGRVLASFDARGYATFYGYDEAGRRTHVTNALGQVTAFGFDQNGNQTSFTDALGRTTDYEHDKLNRRTATIFPLLSGQSTRTTLLTLYDQLGRRVAETNQDSIITRFGYDGLGRLTVVTNADGTLDRIETRYAYDELGNLLEQKDALGRKTKFLYDKLGRRIRRTLPEGQTELSFYDAVGNRTIHTNFNHEQVLEFQYDTFGRLRKKFQDGHEETPLAEFTYNLNGQRLTMKDPSTGAGQTSYEYYPDNRLKKKTVANGLMFQGPGAYQFQYTYDLNGNLTSLIAGTHQVHYQWDALNRLTNVVDEGLYPGRKNTSYQYDAVGNLQGYEYPNLVATTYDYDELNRLEEMAVTKGGDARASFDYDLLKSGHRKNLTEVVNGLGRHVQYGYDPLYRLVGETNANAWPQPWYPMPEVFYDEQPGYSDSAGYDQVGNRRKRTVPFPWDELDTRTYSYNGNDWLDDHTYDANGNTRQVDAVPGQMDEYDLDNRLVKRTTATAIIELAYDGDGNRVRKVLKTSGGSLLKTICYLVDDRNLTGYAQVLEEAVFDSIDQSLPAENRRYTHGHDVISQRQSSGAVHFYGYDGHGTVRFLASQSGTISDTYTYDAYGLLTASIGLTPNNYLFAGEHFESGLGLYYNRARYLNPNPGRFWTMDTFEGFQSDVGSLHDYLYAHVDPVNRLDPSGHTDFIQMLATTKVGATIIAMGGTAVALASRNASTILRGTARAAEVAQRVIASGGDIVAWEERVVRVTQSGMQMLGRFKLDMIVRLPGKTVNTMIESKGAPWDLFFKNTTGWNNFIANLTRQSNTFGQASQSASGVTIQERVIYFTSQAPQGAEKAVQQIKAALGNNYQTVLWGEKALEEFLGGGP
jgi:RHS repeat-associated protein